MARYRNRKQALEGPLISFSDRPGSRTERVVLENDGRRGEYLYVSAHLPSPGPGDGSYALTIATRRR